MPRQFRSGFTLVETLICIGIIAMLTGLITAAGSRAWRKANSTRCLSNLHQISVALSTSTGGPGVSRNESGVYGGGSTADFKCPSYPANHTGYGVNSFCERLHAAMPNPTGTAYLLETRDSNLLSGPLPATATELYKSVDVTRHGASANYLFGDGHAEPVAWETVEKIYTPQHNFINPKAPW